ncbi:hypothetical protein TrRE_jg12913 [Triparma retinervis]|uniref:RNA helicase n=1 Tax=Triparma retinervis TaxID=2557542 RepID=A0A9W6Z957_9STRA|nr:hypothetical protein TrRE_jg12913 [Triparma retinervis]
MILSFPRGIDIPEVDLVIQYEPPRDVDTYVHRSGRTGRAGRSGTSILLFTPREAGDVIKIERSLGHGFKFDLTGPPTAAAALAAAAKTSALACTSVPMETRAHFQQAADGLLESGEDPASIIAACLAAISKRSATVVSKSLLTGQQGFMTLKISSDKEAGRNGVSSGDVMFAVTKLAEAARAEMVDGDEDVDELELSKRGFPYNCDVGKIQTFREMATAGVAAAGAEVEVAMIQGWRRRRL